MPVLPRGRFAARPPALPHRSRSASNRAASASLGPGMASRIRSVMRCGFCRWIRRSPGSLEGFLWGLVLLFGLWLGLFLAIRRCERPTSCLKLVLATLFMLAGGLVALAERHPLLRRGAVSTSSSAAASSSPLSRGSRSRSSPRSPGRHCAELWTAVIGRMLGWGLIAIAPFARGRVQHKRFVLGNALAVCVVAPSSPGA